ncbi:hypothetical protein Q5P01_000370 [Channa striata]|uniref:Uncharacterized protein n=1 Tax=Channa striata TaxID=64152 RepID=A0AA88IKF1_CHASR|nr:hypothetical protein Q5P01_000370 [Channa striata]
MNDNDEKLECDCLHSKTKPLRRRRRGLRGADGRRRRQSFHQEECNISSSGEDGRAAPEATVQPVSQTPVADGVEAECEVDSAVGCEPDGAAVQVYLEMVDGDVSGGQTSGVPVSDLGRRLPAAITALLAAKALETAAFGAYYDVTVNLKEVADDAFTRASQKRGTASLQEAKDRAAVVLNAADKTN